MLWWLIAGCRIAMEPPPAPADDPSAGYAALLAEVVDERGLVDYDALAANRAPLDAYVGWLGRPKGRSNDGDDRLADDLNAYNAFVLWGVLETGRPASVQDVPGRFFSKPGAGFFVERAYTLGYDHVSLWELEHERIRVRSMDVRVHAAMNCASQSCPPLRRELYDAKRISQQLTDQMHTWVNDPRGIRVTPDHLEFSPIFDWFAKDFSFWTGHKTLCEVTAKYAEPALAERLDTLNTQGCPAPFFEYDWRLNDQALAPSP